MSINHRASDRLETFLKAKIVFQNGTRTFDCVIRDLSDTGAKIEVGGADAIPDAFELQIPKKGRTYSVEIRWRLENRLGLRFVGRSDEAGAETGPTRAALIEENARLKAAVKVLADRLIYLGEPVDRSLFETGTRAEPAA